MLRLLVGDDHRVLREGLKKIIEQTRDMVVVAEAADGAEVLEQMSKARPDVVLLDISMPGSNGLDVLKQLKVKHPKLPILMLSQYPEDQYAMRALRAGASGYMTKESASIELIAAVRKVAAGGKYISASLAEQMASSFGLDPDRPLHEKLSDREYEILCLLGVGKTVSDIGREICLSVKTISTYRTRILEKMKMTRTSELIMYVLKYQLVPMVEVHADSSRKKPISLLASKKRSRC